MKLEKLLMFFQIFMNRIKDITQFKKQTIQFFVENISLKIQQSLLENLTSSTPKNTLHCRKSGSDSNFNHFQPIYLFFLIFSLNPPWWKNPCLIGLNFNSSSLCLLHNFILGSRVLSSFYITHYFPSCHPTIPSWNNTTYFSHPKFLTIYFFAKIDNTKYLIVIYWFQTHSAKIQTSQIVLKIRAKNAEQFKSFHFTQIKFKFCCQGMENVFWGSHLSQYKDST